ncbi:hypothetical protein HMPREF2533_02984 [Bacteroides fragilis]|uniref:Uncharacterized protein n=2 Tax=Bacteroides fragilis TaxID=817 RepID=A0A016CNK3_BACFG|nr:hypothetical protein M100_2667 [Bacteroides fragilis str. 1007-1-F \
MKNFLSKCNFDIAICIISLHIEKYEKKYLLLRKILLIWRRMVI